MWKHYSTTQTETVCETQHWTLGASLRSAVLALQTLHTLRLVDQVPCPAQSCAGQLSGGGLTAIPHRIAAGALAGFAVTPMAVTKSEITTVRHAGDRACLCVRGSRVEIPYGRSWLPQTVGQSCELAGSQCAGTERTLPQLAVVWVELLTCWNQRQSRSPL
ncbi:hypothetical protein AAFF_G00426690 [Aldrovandia affinis]|uniref:Uncharacterized protein n=1 Tax=Aldrovandia affinis TaxID=143900 RepID=A0AAD7WJL1_9TELE|nr:hypothetical protein AAFF_G00426690 [Aldrovandia affinis]